MSSIVKGLKLIVVNALWVICSLPIFTIGASSCAACYVCLKLLNDEEGNIVFASRKDYQVKHGGKRIELGEIETAVMSIPDIKAACCVQRRIDDTLVLYYTGDIEKADIQKLVSDKLPKYMIPGEYLKKDELPMLESGKLNRKLMDEMVNEI